MSDLEFFTPGEGGESYDPAAFERFKEQMKKNAAFIAAARKGEQKQKQKEDRLAAILLKFIQHNKKSSILMSASRLLQENIPASFVLAIIILGNEELKEEAAAELKQLKAAEISAGAEQEQQDAPSESALEGAGYQAQAAEFALTARIADESLPLKLKAQIDEWAKGIFEAGSAVPFRVLETALSKEGNVKKVVIDCTAEVLLDFFAVNKGPHITYDAFFGFSELLMQGVMKRLQKQIENQKELH